MAVKVHVSGSYLEDQRVEASLCSAPSVQLQRVFERNTTMKMSKTIATIAAFAAVLPAAAMAEEGGRPLTATLSGANEVPGPGDADGSGIGTVRVNPGQGRLCYTLSVSNIAPATLGHFHFGDAGTNGPVIIDLQAPTGGSSQGCVTISRDLAKAIIQNPEGYYFNVHNAEFRPGAIRGQLGR